jgi:hypothetical protein
VTLHIHGLLYCPPLFGDTSLIWAEWCVDGQPERKRFIIDNFELPMDQLKDIPVGVIEAIGELISEAKGDSKPSDAS